MPFLAGPPLSYRDALAKLEAIAREQRATRPEPIVTVPLDQAVGGIVAYDHICPESTPRHDTSAMDGYAIQSPRTAAASPAKPVRFRIVGRIAAGDDPDRLRLSSTDGDESETCVEIMTGAVFPPGYDACLKLEDTTPLSNEPDTISVSKPIPPNANRRLAATDLHQNQTLLRAGTTLQLPHIPPLASAGFNTISLTRPPRIAILSTGKELLQNTPDTNGPYLTAAAKSLGATPHFLGIVDDDYAQLEQHLQQARSTATAHGDKGYDMLVTTGAVSKGRFDFIRVVLDRLGAEVVFHGVAIRPGHPVLFALLPPVCDGARGLPFFGLPGNPGAAAACFRFLVVPFVRALRGQGRECPGKVRLVGEGGEGVRQGVDCFRHGVVRVGLGGERVVEVSREQSPAKLGPFLGVNCWVHCRARMDAEEIEGGIDVVDCYNFSPGSEN